MAKKKAPGKYVKCTGYEAFVPNPLPPEIDWTGRVIRSLSDADRLIGQLSGEGKKLHEQATKDKDLRNIVAKLEKRLASLSS